MPNFLIITETIPNYSKKDIDCGKTPKIVIRLCLCLKEAFFLAYKIRKYIDFYIFIEEGEILIKFKGSQLKYLGPDERSQSLLLEKALKKAQSIGYSYSKTFIKSTPGIYVKKVKFKKFIQNQEDVQTFFVLNLFHKEQLKEIEVIYNIKKINNHKNSIFICFLNYNPSKFNNYIPYLQCLNNINAFEGISKNYEKLSCWDKILYINHYLDKINYDS